MKNIEKYPNTKGALDAYNALDSKTVSFDAWLVCEYKEPHAPTLEETATLKREVAELRECLEQAYGDKIGTYTMKGNEVERWRKALCEKGETK